jgi:signal transduction histidine kinase
MQTEAPPTPTSLDLLLVEDNPGDARLVEALVEDGAADLTDDGDVSLTHRDSLAAGFDALETAPPDLVLLDLDLPDSTGLETLDRVLDATEGVPVVVLTGRPEENLGLEAVRRGAQDYLVKGSFDVEAFVHAVHYAIERSRTQRELRRTTKELAILNQLMRHDVRNDISLVVGRSHQLSEYVDPRGEELLAEVVTAANHVLQLTRTVGDTVETITREGETPLQPVDPSAVVERQVEKACHLYGEGSVTVEGDLTDAAVAADELLSAVVGNLLGNALLYTSDDPDVRVSTTVDDETVTIHVADNGPGVPDDQKERIFGQGTRGVESQGTGIGLYLVDQLVQQYGGRIWVTDNEPTGAVFHVELRRARP